MTATDELRRLLDERGVKWQAPTSFDGTARYDTTSGGYWFHEFNGKMTIHGLTPAQAVEATLGRGECEVEGYDDGVDEGMDGEWYSYGPPTWHLSCGHECEGVEGPNFCPVCGRRVKEVDE